MDNSNRERDTWKKVTLRLQTLRKESWNTAAATNMPTDKT